MMKYLLILAAAVAIPALAQAEEGAGEELLTGAELYENCQGDADEAPPKAYCKEFVYGLVHTLVGLQEMQPEADKIFCIDPNKIGLDEVTLKVTEWLGEHPDRHEEPAYLLTAEALREYYACPEQEVSIFE